MALLLRTFWDDPWEGMMQPSRLGGQDFGNILTDDVFRPIVNMTSPYYHRHPQLARTASQVGTGGTSEVVNTDKEFRVCLDVQHFKPEEITIKTKDNRIIIHAMHEERPDEHGFIHREFTRQYVLPKDVDPATVTSSLSQTGRLTLKAPKQTLEVPKETPIPITMETDEPKEQVAAAKNPAKKK